MLEFAELKGINLDEATARRVQRAANELLERQFLHAGDRGAMQYYELLTQKRYWGLFTAFFEMCGRRLIKNDQERWVGIVPDLEVLDPPRMRLPETLLALMLAYMHQDGVNQGEIERGGVVCKDTAELFELYASVLGRERMRERELQNQLHEFKRRGIVAFGETDPETGDFEIYIRPLVQHLVTGDVLTLLRRYAQRHEPEIAEDDETAAPAAEASEAHDDAAAPTPQAGALAPDTSNGAGDA